MDPLLEAFLGPGFRRGAFNGEAALIPFWPAYRKLPLLQLGSMFLFFVIWMIAALEFFQFNPAAAIIVPVLAMSLLHGAGANSLLWRRANRVRAEALKKGLEGDAALEYMRREAKPLPAGLLVAGVPGIGLVIYLLPAMRPHDDHGKMYVAYMKADLRRLLTAQEVYFAEARRYAESVNHLDYTASSYVTIHILAADSTGWSARASNNAGRETCGVFVGTAQPPVSGGFEGEPKCDGRR